MGESVVAVNTLNVNYIFTQQNISVTCSQAVFQGISIKPNRSIPTADATINETRVYDAIVNSTSKNATGYVGFGTGAIVVGITTTINGIVSTADNNTKADYS